MYFVYVLRSLKDGKFYTGHTDDLTKRIDEHNNGLTVSTKYRRPFELIYYEASRNRKDAARRERYLKTTYGKRYIKNRLANELHNQSDE
jgi:putative endonuclease